MKNSSKIKTTISKTIVRFAPSPTGYLHLGGARTALFNFLLSKKNNGKFILRIEDTDKNRSKEEYVEDIKDSLKWLGIKWNKLYFQSKRTRIYKKYLELLFKKNAAFYCYHRKDEIKILPHFCEHFSSEPKDKSIKPIIRFKVPRNREIVFNDLIRGEIKVNTDNIGDFSIAKNLDEPLYNLAASIDDWKMQITHILRGEDHISNTHKQILIYQALDVDILPQFAHLPLILGHDLSKLSKRHADTSLRFYINKGFLRETLINFLALLGWNSKDNREIFSMEDLIKEFTLEKVQKKGAVFNIEKLFWFNKLYLKSRNCSDLLSLTSNLFNNEYGKTVELKKDFLCRIIDVEKSRATDLADLVRISHYFFKLPIYEKNILLWKDTQYNKTKEALLHAKDVIFSLDDKSINNVTMLKEILMEKANNFDNDRGKFLWPLRVALSGLEKSASPFEIVYVLDKEESLKRIELALSKL